MDSELEQLYSEAGEIWAKKRTSEDGQELWLPLVIHLIDTQNTIDWLFNHWLSGGTKKLLLSEIEEDSLNNLVKFLGFAHDIGKGTPAFEIKPSYGGDRPIDADLLEKLQKVGIKGLTSGFKLPNAKVSPHSVAGESLLENFDVPETVAAIVGGHHGDAREEIPTDQIDDFTANYYQDDQESAIQDPWKRIQNRLFHYALISSGFKEVSEIPDVSETAAVILEGLLITADWLASGEYLNDDENKPMFPLISITESAEDVDTQSRFRNAIETWYLGGEWNPQKVLIQDDPYLQRWGFIARPVQKEITATIDSTVDPGILVVEAPMGLGKTEIALVAAEQLAYKTQRSGLFIGLPTQATSNAMFDRVENWLEFLAEDQDESFPIKLMHGKAMFNESYEKLPRASNVDSDSGVIVNQWFSGKKSILTKFAVGTIDNFLLMALKQKHLFLRHLGFSEKVVIIDEAHAYDIFMSEFLYEAVKWLGAYHVPIVVLSATLPRAKRVDLISAYYEGRTGERLNISESVGPSHWSQSAAYPLLTYTDGSEVKQITTFPGESNQKQLKVTLKRIDSDEASVIAKTLELIKDGGVAGIIVNTVGRAQKMAKLVPSGISWLLLHSFFLATDRAKQEEKVQQLVGKGANRPNKLIVIGTQVLEQSLDIDFDVLLTDIAPMDLLLQRAGRMHRHSIKRPPLLATPQMFVMDALTPGEYSRANETVYEKYLLMKTDYYLADQIKLPQDISNLVQKVYDTDSDPKFVGIEDEKRCFFKHMKEKKRRSKAFRLSKPNSRRTLHGWLSRSHNQVSEDDPKVAAAVRDIRETIEVVLLKEKDGEICLLDDRNIQACSSKEVAEQLIRIPARVTPPDKIGKTIEQLEKITFERFSFWQNDRWLRGALALVLNENGLFEVNGFQLSYSKKYGLITEKEGTDD